MTVVREPRDAVWCEKGFEASFGSLYELAGPRSGFRNGTLPGVIWNHGAGVDTANQPEQWANVANDVGSIGANLRPLIACHYALLSTPHFDGTLTQEQNSWGNDNERSNLVDATTWLLSPTGGGARPGKVAIMGFSMGGTSTFGLVKALGRTNVAGVVLVEPVVDLSWQRGTDANHLVLGVLAGGSHSSTLTATTNVFLPTDVAQRRIVSFDLSPFSPHYITHYTSPTQVTVTPPFSPAKAGGTGFIVISEEFSGFHYDSINLAYLNDAHNPNPGSTVNDARWAVIAAEHDPMRILDFLIDVPTRIYINSPDYLVGCHLTPSRQEVFLNRLSNGSLVTFPDGAHNVFHLPGVEVAEWLDGLDWS